jgi:hypothetical protein
MPRAGFDHCADDIDVGRSLAGHDTAGRIADVGAVEAEANAADQLRQAALAEVGVGATRASRGAVAARLGTADERIGISAGRLWAGLEHLSNGHFRPFDVGRQLRAGCRLGRSTGSSQTRASHPKRNGAAARSRSTFGDSTGPIASFLPIMVFAVAFGLSMDYEVFLVSRMHEECVHTRDAHS